MNLRIKTIRTYNHLSQEEFGKRIGIGKTSVSKLESGENNPSERTIKLICSEFNVNEDWLRDGTGGEENMFVKPETNNLVAMAAKLLGEKDPAFEAFIETYSKLSPSNRKVILDFGLDFLKHMHDKSENNGN